MFSSFRLFRRIFLRVRGIIAKNRRRFRFARWCIAFKTRWRRKPGKIMNAIVWHLNCIPEITERYLSRVQKMAAGRFFCFCFSSPTKIGHSKWLILAHKMANRSVSVEKLWHRILRTFRSDLETSNTVEHIPKSAPELQRGSLPSVDEIPRAT